MVDTRVSVTDPGGVTPGHTTAPGMRIPPSNTCATARALSVASGSGHSAVDEVTERTWPLPPFNLPWGCKAKRELGACKQESFCQRRHRIACSATQNSDRTRSSQSRASPPAPALGPRHRLRNCGRSGPTPPPGTGPVRADQRRLERARGPRTLSEVRNTRVSFRNPFRSSDAHICPVTMDARVGVGQSSMPARGVHSPTLSSSSSTLSPNSPPRLLRAQHHTPPSVWYTYSPDVQPNPHSPPFPPHSSH